MVNVAGTFPAVLIDYFANFLQTFDMGRFAKNSTIEVIDGLYVKQSANSPYYQAYSRIDGASFRKSTKCKDLEQAKRAALDMFYDAKRRAADGIGHSTVSFKKLAEVYLNFIQHEHKCDDYHRPTTKRHFMPFFEKFKDIRKIKAADINDYLAYRRNKNTEPPSPQTLNRENSVLRQMFAHAVKQGWLKEAVTIEHQNDRLHRRRRAHFTHKEYRKLYSTARSRIARIKGDRLAKTILFARNHEHAKFIEERFNHHYPHYKGHFARIIDHYAKYPQSLLDDFSQKDKTPHIAISVDMLDTGIDVPEVANLVFFKPVYSKIKFWQMIGRGTRLCPELFGPDDDKQDFRVFDFCFNFDFFRENPQGIETGGAIPLGARLFRSRVQLLTHVQRNPGLDLGAALSGSLTNELHGEVAAMNCENFIVRMRLEAVERYREHKAWEQLSDADHERLQREVAGLPSEIDTDEIESRMFDLTALRMQLALAEDDMAVYENHKQRMVEIAMLLEEKTSIPAVQAQLDYLALMQESEFWEGMNLNGLEELRLRLRGLMLFLDKKKRKIVYTDFEDEVLNVRRGEPIPMPKMTGAQYEKKVRSYLDSHRDQLVIHRLRTNRPLTAADLEGLEAALMEIGEEDGETLLSGLLARSAAPSLAYFVRTLVGLDRSAAQAAFSEFLNDRSLSPPQIRFIEMVIEQLTARGVMDASALYESPFSNVHGGGPDELFSGKENVIEGIFEKLEELNTEVTSKAN